MASLRNIVSRVTCAKILPAPPLSTTYLLTQRVRYTFTDRGKVFALLGYYVALRKRFQQEILASHEHHGTIKQTWVMTREQHANAHDEDEEHREEKLVQAT